MRHLELCVIIVLQRFGSNWDLVNCQVPFAFCNVINYEMQGLALVTPLQEVFAGAGDI